VQYRDYALTATLPVSLRMTPYALTLTLPEGNAGGNVTVNAPGKWGMKQPDVTMTAKGGKYLLALPAGMRTVTLTAQ
jgi:hypothetical protein